ncbi:MAG TPA: hypothetical protein VF487_05230 [Chitinophagaceae bacterium]
MRKIYLLTVVLLTTVFLSSCLKDKLTKTYTVLEPVYRTKTEVLADIKSSAARTITDPGKLYYYGNYIFLNEINKGVHIIDNADPARPVIKAFINIPGNLDIAVKGNMLYADLFTDMVTVDITDPLNARLVKVIPAIFPERQYGNGFTADNSKVIVDWIEKKITVAVDNVDDVRPPCASCMVFFSNSQGSTASTKSGAGGSMARFAVVNNYMYAVNASSIIVVDVTAADQPIRKGTYSAGWNIETIYPFRDKLFLGSSSGMFIYSIANPAVPAREGMAAHFRACDPVVADDNYAFVTLRSGNFCQGTNNQLDIVNVQNVMSPTIIKTYPMTNPFGLAKDGHLLFICDGKDGLKVYDATDVQSLRLIKRIGNMETYDVIAGNNKLILVAKNGLYQYDYSDANNIRQLSKISVNR